MKIDDILALDDFKQTVDILTRDSNKERNREEYRAEYNGERTRRLTSVGYRENKQIDVYSETEVEIDKDGNEIPKKQVQKLF